MRRPLLTFLGLFFLGELAGQMIDRNMVYSCGAAAAAAGIVMRSSRQIAAKKTRYYLLLLFLFALGFAWNYGVRLQMVAREALASEAAGEGRSISLEGVVTEQREWAWILRTDLGKLRILTREDEGTSPVSVGDRIRVTGVPERIPGSTNPGSFDSAEYYESEGIRWQMEPEETVLLEQGADPVLSLLDSIRTACREQAEELLPEKEAGILMAMLLGERSGVDRELKELYRQNGIAHVLAISGLHVSLMGTVIMMLLGLCRMSRRKAAVITILLLFLYGFLTGFSPATLRAIWMMTAVNLGSVLRRTADLPTAAGGALFLILMVRPYRITSSGLLMSFLSVAGIIAGGAFYKRIFDRERFLFLPLKLRAPMKHFVEMLLFSVTLQLFLEPVMLRDYYSVSPYSPLLNLLVVPLLTVAVMSGAAGLLISFLPGFRLLGRVLILPCRGILALYEILCRGAAEIPGHEILTGGISGTECLLLLLLILAAMYGLYRILGRNRTGRHRWRYYFLTLLSITVCFLLGAGAALLKNRLSERIIFLDVGQGDGCIVHTKDADLLFDCGSSSRDTVGRDVLIPALRYYGIREVDSVFLSHTDADHVNGVEQLMEQGELYGIRTDRIVFGAGTAEDASRQRLQELAGEAGTDVLEMARGDELSAGETYVRVLLPEPGETGEGNDYSMVCLLSVRGFRVLFTGDIGAEREAELAKILREDRVFDVPEGAETLLPRDGAEENIDILKVAHHGSRFSSSEELLSLWRIREDEGAGIEAESGAGGAAGDGTGCAEDSRAGSGSGIPAAVISCGRKNRYGHPAEETLERLEQAGFTVFRTDRQGAVIVYFP